MAQHGQKHHDYYLVDPSPWPLIGGVAAFIMSVGVVAWMKTSQGGILGLTGPWLFMVGVAGILATMVGWWRDTIDKAVHHGVHTPVVQIGLRYGMMLFIMSEIMFFVAWFWAYFDVSLFPADVQTIRDGIQVGVTGRSEVTGGQWPPVATTDGRFKSTFNPWELPLFNTLILLLSGTTITWAHHALQVGDRKSMLRGLALTIALGMIFTACQVYEYTHAAFQFSGHIYGSVFFMATGFHGAHVVIGTIFLIVIFFQARAGHFTPKQHFGFEAAAWYWHFVDVVWLFLFATIYVFGAGRSAGG